MAVPNQTENDALRGGLKAQNCGEEMGLQTQVTAVFKSLPAAAN